MLTLRDIIKNKASGFTIVELATVILVIGILATITIVSYNHVQYRANETATAGNVHAYVNALEAYKLEYGRYPAYSTCLGSAPADGSGCATLSIQGAGCAGAGVNVGQTVIWSYSADFQADLKPYMDDTIKQTQPMPATSSMTLIEGGDCTLSTHITSPMYESSCGITIDNGKVSICWMSNPNMNQIGQSRLNNKAYRITYVVKGKECPLPKSIAQPSDPPSAYITCAVVGGNVTFK